MCQDQDPEDETRRQELASEGDFSPEVDEENLKPTGEVPGSQRTSLSSQSRDTRNSLGLAVGSTSACLVLEIRERRKCRKALVVPFPDCIQALCPFRLRVTEASL